MANEETIAVTDLEKEQKHQRAEDLRLRFRSLAKKNKKVEDEFNAIDYGENFHVITPMLRAMTVSNTALALKKGASSLYLGLNFVTIGITTDNASGFIGPQLQKIIKATTAGLLTEGLWKPKADIETDALLEKIITVVLVGAIAGGHLLGTKGIGLSSENKNEVLKFSTELVLILMASSRVFKETFRELISTCGGDEKTQNNIAEVLEFITLLILIRMVGQETKESLDTLFETLYRYMLNLLIRIDKQLSEILPDANVNVALQQAKLALESQKFEDFVNAIDGYLEVLGITNEQLNGDIEKICDLGDLIYETSSRKPTDMSSMGIGISVVA